MTYDPPESAYESNRGKPLPQRPANRTSAEDFEKSNDKQDKDNNNGKW